MKTTLIRLGTAVIGGWMLAFPMAQGQERDHKGDGPPPPREHQRGGFDRPGANRGAWMRNPQVRGRLMEMWRDRQRGNGNPQVSPGRRGDFRGWGQGAMGMRPGMMGMKPGGMGMRPNATMPGNNGPVSKARHLRQAAEHLNAAGFKEQAEKANAEAGKMEAEARRDNNADRKPGASEEVEKMRRELDELRGQLRRLKADAAAKRDAPQPAPANPQ